MKKTLIFFFFLMFIISCGGANLKEEIVNIKKIHLLKALVYGPEKFENDTSTKAKAEVRHTLKQSGKILKDESYSFEGVCEPGGIELTVDLKVLSGSNTSKIEKLIRKNAGPSIEPLKATKKLKGYSAIKKYLDEEMSKAKDTFLGMEYIDTSKLFGSSQMQKFLDDNPGNAVILAVIKYDPSMTGPAKVGRTILGNPSSGVTETHNVNIYIQPSTFQLKVFPDIYDMRYSMKKEDNLLKPSGLLPDVPKFETVEPMTFKLKQISAPVLKTLDAKRGPGVKNTFVVQGGKYKSKLSSSEMKKLNSNMGKTVKKAAAVIGKGIGTFVEEKKTGK